MKHANRLTGSIIKVSISILLASMALMPMFFVAKNISETSNRETYVFVGKHDLSGKTHADNDDEQKNMFISDTVEVENLAPDKEYTLTGTLVNKETGEKAGDTVEYKLVSSDESGSGPVMKKTVYNNDTWLEKRRKLFISNIPDMGTYGAYMMLATAAVSLLLMFMGRKLLPVKQVSMLVRKFSFCIILAASSITFSQLAGTGAVYTPVDMEKNVLISFVLVSVTAACLIMGMFLYNGVTVLAAKEGLVERNRTVLTRLNLYFIFGIFSSVLYIPGIMFRNGPAFYSGTALLYAWILWDAYEKMRPANEGVYDRGIYSVVTYSSSRNEHAEEDGEAAEEAAKNSPDADFFDGVTTARQLEERYRQLAKLFHPDGNNGASRTFIKINEQHEALKAFFAKNVPVPKEEPVRRDSWKKHKKRKKRYHYH